MLLAASHYRAMAASEMDGSSASYFGHEMPCCEICVSQQRTCRHSSPLHVLCQAPCPKVALHLHISRLLHIGYRYRTAGAATKLGARSCHGPWRDLTLLCSDPAETVRGLLAQHRP
jgi:hypothetical protein